MELRTTNDGTNDGTNGAGSPAGTGSGGTGRDADAAAVLGTRAGGSAAAAGVGGGPLPRVACDAPELTPHADAPWLRAWLAERLGPLGPAAEPFPAGTAARVPLASFARHAVVAGATGGGKSRLLQCVLESLVRDGWSVLMADPKRETVLAAADALRRAGVPPEEVTLLLPGAPLEGGDGAAVPGAPPVPGAAKAAAAVPGWNPLAAGVPAAQAAADLVAVLAQMSPASWGPRLQDLLTNGLIVAATHGLSVYELVRLLLREDYRAQLLRLPVTPADPAAYAEARAFFAEEFAAWPRGERASAVGPVTNKLRETLRSATLRPLLCARRQTLDLARLWRRQGAVLVHLDRPSLGEEGAHLLAGLLTSLLFRTAARCGAGAPVRVALCLDELFTLQRFAGGALADVLAIARGYNLGLLAACQHLDQLRDDLRAALLANCSVQAFFRLGHADARAVAAALSAGAPETVTRLTLDAPAASARPRAGGAGAPPLGPRAVWRHPVVDARGRPLRPGGGAEAALAAAGLFGAGREQLALAARLAAAGTDAAAAGRLYVRAADTGAPVALSRYVAGLAPHEWWLEGPGRLALAVSFPRPRVSAVERAEEAAQRQAWTRTLMGLPVRHCLLRVDGGTPALVRVATVPDAPPASHPPLRRYLAASLAANGQSPAEAAEAARWREARVAAVAAGRAASGPDGPGDHGDGRRGGDAGGDGTGDLDDTGGAAAGREEAADDGSIA